MATAAILPLEKRVIPVNNKNGLLKDAPAVHKVWVEARTWTRYETPPDAGEINLPGAVDSWLGTSRAISSQLSWLLRLPCNVFWSQLKDAIDQMLTHPPGSYKPISYEQVSD